MRIRTAKLDDLSAILRLYRFLQPDDPVLDSNDTNVLVHWEQILANPNYRYILVEEKKEIVSTCVITLVENLTRSMRPYALIENVVTDPAFRNQGIGTKLLKAAVEIAWESDCYKVMLMTGSKREETIRFYKGAGFEKGIKTGFIAYPKKTKANQALQATSASARRLS